MIIIHALMQVNPEREEQFLAEAKTLLAATHEEEGNLSYELYKHAAQENVYIMVETWRDAAAVGSHNTSPHFTGFAAKAGEFLTAPLDVKVYNGELLQQ
ncbi:monooxygenase [Paenibacillus sp. FSL H7-0357]|jgi:quinol monooxygenase YgiN|uniref:putative quinol monooxygenase n=1 Tax=unclassified Paenibacillus TaxID=185978 RepID=UPI0004F76E3A|nr:putative quinol monooxygenase [Paenibacillus sp. FSL H7-0357]AIQ15745.1 monooxygenase [Paenibacillus sp. FSL H7-0357]